MSDGSLSQDEIDALLSGADDLGAAPSAASAAGAEPRDDLSSLDALVGTPAVGAPAAAAPTGKIDLSEAQRNPAIKNLQLLMDVPMQITVELGRTTYTVREILGLGEGSIIELDKQANEPVDLLVNKKLIARGEVVVIDENFGVRVTSIVDLVERLRSLTAR
jgi:flagellar motor switch protein FliN/FliY